MPATNATALLPIPPEAARLPDQTDDPAQDPAFDRDFRPVGAMAFFILFVLLGAGIWFGIYLLMLHRI